MYSISIYVYDIYLPVYILRSWTMNNYQVKYIHIATVWLVIFDGLNFCGLGSLDDFMGLYFHGIYSNFFNTSPVYIKFSIF